MGWIPGFFVGAMRYGRALPLREIAEASGGWAALEAAGPDRLVELGVSRADAVAWHAAVPERSAGDVLTLADPRYPRRLAALPDAPPVLCVQGDAACLDGPAWAIVGTRECTSYGVSVARHLASSLAAAGGVVVSGLARGIDGHAHRAALEQGRTIAVLGHGLAFVAPRTHRRLRDRLLERGGLLVSAFEDGVAPRPWTFPARNAWISGLSDGVIVVEAGLRSGARITARAAANQGRPVYVVPGPLGAPASRGCLELIAEGANVVTDVVEFVRFVAGTGGPQVDWLGALFGGRTLDDVARSSGRSVASLLAELSVLEAEGRVVRLPGHRYAPGALPA